MIEWDETNTDLYSQSIEAQKWVGENLLTQNSTDNTETIGDLTRITDQTYIKDGLTLVIVRTYKNSTTCAIASATYTLTEN